MSTTLPKPRNSRAPRTKAQTAPDKTVTEGLLTLEQRADIIAACGGPVAPVPPVHTRWSTMFAVLSKGHSIPLTTLARVEAWEWFRDKASVPTVAMTGKGIGLVIAGLIVYERDNLLTSIRKGGRK